MFIIRSIYKNKPTIIEIRKTKRGAENAKSNREKSGCWDRVEIIKANEPFNIVDYSM